MHVLWNRAAMLAVVFVAGTVAPAQAQSQSELLDRCQELAREVESSGGGVHLDLQISTCGAAIEKTPESMNGTLGYLYGVRGTAYFIKGLNVLALSDFNQSIRFEPDYAPSFCNRGLLKKKIGDLSGAEADFAVYRRMRPQNKCQ